MQFTRREIPLYFIPAGDGHVRIHFHKSLWLTKYA
jgi:hypothetical protein